MDLEVNGDRLVNVILIILVFGWKYYNCVDN